MEILSFTSGEGERPAPQDLEERLRIVEEKIRRDAREMVEVFKIDIPQFVRRQVRDRFIAAGEFADSFDAAKLRALKADVEATAARAGSEIVPLLEEWSLWIEGAKACPPPSERRDLAGNPEIHARLQRAGSYVREVLERHGFEGVGATEFASLYRLPTWFIGGRLLVSLVESYWRSMEELLAIREALRAVKDRDERAKRAERWDAA
jgi:hypothetical protein